MIMIDFDMRFKIYIMITFNIARLRAVNSGVGRPLPFLGTSSTISLCVAVFVYFVSSYFSLYFAKEFDLHLSGFEHYYIDSTKDVHCPMFINIVEAKQIEI